MEKTVHRGFGSELSAKLSLMWPIKKEQLIPLMVTQRAVAS